MARISNVAEPPEETQPIETADPAQETGRSEETTGAPEKIGFFDQLSSYTSSQWERLMIYVYRLAPITDRRATGNKAVYVKKYAGPVDEEQLKHDCGSGTYRLQLNQIGANGKSKPIRQHVVDIEDTKYPPLVPPGEWVDDPANLRWAWCRKKEEPAAPGQQQNPWTPETILRMAKELRPEPVKEDHVSMTRAVLDAVKDTRASMSSMNDPATLIALITQVVSMSKPAEVKPDNTITTILTQMLAASDKRAEAAEKLAAEERKEAAAERQRQHESQMKALESRGDPMDMVDKVLNLQEKLGGAQQPKGNWKEQLVEQGFQALPDILTAVKAWGYSRAQPIQQPQRPQPTPISQPAPAAAPQPAIEATPTGETMPQLDPDTAFLVKIFEAQGRQFVAAFVNDPNSGPDVARTVALFGGQATYERIARMGREKILATIELIPQMKADLLGAGTPEMLNDFIDGFIDPEEPDDEDEDDDTPDQPEIVPPQPGNIPQPTAKRSKKATA